MYQGFLLFPQKQVHSAVSLKINKTCVIGKMALKKNQNEGTPWQSRGEDSVLSMPQAGVQALIRELGSPKR